MTGPDPDQNRCWCQHTEEQHVDPDGYLGDCDACDCRVFMAYTESDADQDAAIEMAARAWDQVLEGWL